MTDRLYAVPVDDETLAVRASPATPLEVRRLYEDPGSGYLFVAQAASWPALNIAERQAIEPFFEWERASAYWWRTLRPARVALTGITPALEVARLLERGEIVSGGADPDQRPDDEWSFCAYATLDARSLRDPGGPRPFADAYGETDVLQTEVVHMFRATFPLVSPDVVWLRFIDVANVREVHRRAFNAELDVLTQLHAGAPHLFSAVLHYGELRSVRYMGQYAAQSPVVGLAPSDLFGIAGRAPFGGVRLAVREIALDVTSLMVVAHDRDRCLGLLSPGLLRVRPDLSTASRTVRAKFVMLPAAGMPKGRLAPSVTELFPEGAARRLLEQFDGPYVHSRRADHVALGHLIEWVLELSAVEDAPLTELATRLRQGKIKRMRDAEVRLQDIVDGSRTTLL